jgi:glycosyltransferase involved in cell wall biosynthesis
VLSVCFIARNEEKNLPRALASVRDVADEIIVADTGSTDHTVKISQESGAIVCHFPWRDDFSAARNFAISHARGDWILWMDADEELLPESAAELRASLERPDALAYFIRRQDLTEADRLDYYTMMWQLRLFRRRDDLRFQGRCHPDFRPEIGEIEAKTGLQAHLSSITIRHYGYMGALKPAKLRRAARLLEMELLERPGQPPPGFCR